MERIGVAKHSELEPALRWLKDMHVLWGSIEHTAQAGILQYSNLLESAFVGFCLYRSHVVLGLNR